MADEFYRDGILYSIPIKDIIPNPKNPRKTFDYKELEKLAQSIREVGILQPLVLVPGEEGELGLPLRIVAGERRWRAAQLAGLCSVTALIRKLTPAQEAEVMLIENLQRQDLSPIEEAQAYQELLREHNYTQEALGEKIGVSQGHIANRLRLLRLPDSIQDNISRKILSAGHANALLRLEKFPALMKKAAKVIAEEQVPVAKANETIKKIIAVEGRPLFLDYNNKPEFKTADCEKCEFMLLGNRHSYDSVQPYCAKPSCWDKKQQQVKRDRELALADRVQKMAKKQGVVELDKLSYDQYEEFVEYKTKDIDLAECEGCEHKKPAKKSYKDELTEACFQPSCFKKKQAAATREKNKVVRNILQEELNQVAILAGLKAASLKRWEPGGCTNQVNSSFVMDRPTLIYLAAMILASVNQLHDRKITLFRYLKDKFGWEQDLLKRGSWGLLNDEWGHFRQLLETLTDQQLYDVIFEWPAMARGMDGAAGWVLQQGTSQVQEIHQADNAPIEKNPGPVCQHPVRALIGRVIRTHYDTGGVVAGVSGPKDDGHYTVNYRDPSDKSKRLSIINSITVIDGVVMCEGVPLTVLDKPEELPSRRYLDDKGRELFVSTGLGSEYGTFWQSEKGGLHRVKSPAMPMTSSREEAQANLDAWAKKKGLRPVEPAGDDHCQREQTA